MGENVTPRVTEANLKTDNCWWMNPKVKEMLQEGCGVDTVTSPSESRQTDPVKCGELVAVPGIDGEKGTRPTLPKPGRELEPFP